MTFSFSLSRSFTHMTSTNTGQVAGQRVTCRCLALRADCPGYRLSLTRDQHHTPVEPTPEPGCATCPWGGRESNVIMWITWIDVGWTLWIHALFSDSSSPGSWHPEA